MAPRLYLVPSTDTALRHARAHGVAVQRAQPLAPVHWLLPDARAIRQARRALGTTLGVHLWQIYRLGRSVLLRAGDAPQEVGDTATRRLLVRLLATMAAAGELTTFGPVQDKPGFVQALREWVQEMKSQGIDPTRVRAHAANERDHQLARLYEQYQAFLHAGSLSDADGLLWLAAEALEVDVSLFSDAAPFFVLGFDQFNPLQLRILRALAARLEPFALYLLWDEARAPDSLALTRLRQTRAALHAHLPNLQEEVLAEPEPPAPALAHLRRTLFEAPHPLAKPAESVRAIAAPSREAEVRMALRAVKRLLREGTAPTQIALLAPDLTPYTRLVHAVSTEYGLPIAIAERLDANPAVAALLGALTLAPAFPRRATFDALRSPFLPQPWLDAEGIGYLDRLTREQPVIAGTAQWLDALRPLTRKAGWEEEWGTPRLAATLGPEALEGLRAGLQAFFAHWTPPATATYANFARWTEVRLWGDEIEGGAPPGLLAAVAPESQPQNEAALRGFGRALRALVEAATLLPPEESTVPWATFLSELGRLVAAMAVEAAHGETIRFGVLGAGRAVAVDHLFVLGMSEGEFPRLPTPDPFYAPAERRHHAAQPDSLPLRCPDGADDASLWWQVLAHCRRTLTLMRPRLDAKGVPWEPSPYWDAVLTQVPVQVEEPPIEAIPDPADAASHAELIVALAVTRAAAVPEPLRSAWEAARVAHNVQVQRATRDLPPGPYEGILTDPALIAELGARFGPEHGWSVSRLNRYGKCPYGFFVQVVLALEPLPDPEEGLDAAQAGQLLHAVLELLFTRLAEAGIRPTPATREAVLAQLDESCDTVFPSAPWRYGFREGALWAQEQAEMRRMLRALAEAECTNDDGFDPFRQEMRFGGRGSILPRLRLDVGGTTFELHGVIDRVDADAMGRLRVVDYKSSSALFTEDDILAGRALQSALYALAAEALLGKPVVQSYYLHLRTQQQSGLVEGSGSFHVQAALERAARFVEAARAGHFPAAPSRAARSGTACDDHCTLAPMCRVTRASIAKGTVMRDA